jgi:hypothetical protein
MLSLVWTILVAFFIVWLLGLGLNWSGWIWALFGAAVILLVYSTLIGRHGGVH